MHNKVHSHLTAALFCVAVFLFSAQSSLACSRAIPFNHEELFVADAIAVVTALGYVGNPDTSLWTTGVPETEVRFRVDEVLSGRNLPKEIVLNAYVSDVDDYNDQPVPYTFVRRNGRSGSCHANTYRTGGRFLVFLKETPKGYTTNISALGPSNEQLREGNDPWLEWVRAEIKKRLQKPKLKSQSPVRSTRTGKP